MAKKVEKVPTIRRLDRILYEQELARLQVELV